MNFQLEHVYCAISWMLYLFMHIFCGTIIFYSTAFIVHISPFRRSPYNLFYFALADQHQLPSVQEIADKYCCESVLANISLEVKNVIKYKISLSMKKNSSKDQLIE